MSLIPTRLGLDQGCKLRFLCVVKVQKSNSKIAGFTSYDKSLCNCLIVHPLHYLYLFKYFIPNRYVKMQLFKMQLFARATLHL